MHNRIMTHARQTQAKSAGFTLIELMIVIAILGIVVAIALPSYQDSVSKSRRADAQGVLTSFANTMERYYTTNSTYAGAGASGGNTGAPTIFSTEAPLDGATKYYDLTIVSSSSTSFVIQAAPKNGQSGDGNLRLTSTGVRTWDEVGDASYSSSW